MKLGEYLAALEETQAAFSARSGVPQQTVSRIVNGEIPRLETAALIVGASRRKPAPDGNTVRYEDLMPAGQGAA